MTEPTSVSVSPVHVTPAQVTPAQVTPDEIADRIGIHRPTAQQSLVITADLEPALVVAGAGSGKTETMAFRVLWLIANGKVRPEHILGLTFTRKAAGELAERMRERIAALRAVGLVPARTEADDAGDPAAALLDAPTVSTYNSFAGSIFRENAALLGQDGDAVLLGEASSWLLARELVRTSDDPRLTAAGKRVDDVTSAVVRVSAALADNDADPAAVEQMISRLLETESLPAGGSGAYALDSVLSKVRDLPVLLDLAQRFDEVKRERGYQQFSDQLVTALRVLERHPRVAETLRDRYRVVILDEYQDTSVVQTRVLSQLFRGTAVMAVGDPHQAIYGWRGASASNLAQFPAWFDATRRFDLSVSWRNGVRILDAANTVIEPLVADSPVPVARLDPRPGADAEPVEVVYAHTVADEAREVAEWFGRRLADRTEWNAPKTEGDPLVPPTAALLLRARSTLEHFIAAFQKAGVPYHVLGVGGLLAEPVIADLVAALTVIDDPAGGSELIRLLTGSRWRIGPADIVQLREVARWLERRDLSQKQHDAVVVDAFRASVVDEESASIVDALDFVGSAPSGHTMLAGFSPEGLIRMREAGRLFADLRKRVRLDLADLVTVVIQSLDLDIEVEANDSRPTGDRAFEAFFDALDGFEALGQGASLRAFLGWLREAETRDRLTPRSDPPQVGCVQILTIHGSKGLEWDLVAVPRLVTDELPRSNRDAQGWVAFGQLPYEFRGDSESLPVFGWRGAESRKDLIERHKAYKAEVYGEQLLEDRRLAYVAMTRARRRLLVSGSFWSTQKDQRAPSTYLAELVAAGVVATLPEPPDDEVNPLLADPNVVEWPRDPLGGRRERVLAAAQRVEEAPADPARAGGWQREVELLLEERRQAAQGPSAPPPPPRIPASRFSEYVSDPAAVAARLLRPMPEKPYRATRLGTLFHAWVENRSLAPTGGQDALLDPEDLDALATEVDAELVGADLETLTRLQATFEASPWADRKPIEVEREIHLPFDGRIVICKIDAIYRVSTGSTGEDRYQVVDWKTGKAPRDDADLERKQLQLALYRLAYSKWSGIDPDLIDAVFYFVADDQVVRPTRIDSEAELLARWRAAFGE